MLYTPRWHGVLLALDREMPNKCTLLLDNSYFGQ